MPNSIVKKFQKIGFVLGLIFSVLSLEAQFKVGEASGYINAGLGGDNAWVIAHNSAGLAYADSLQVGVFYNTRFQTKELATKGLVVSHPLKKSTIGLWFSSYGYSQFSRNQMGIAVAKKLGEKLSLGVQFHYLNINIGEGYGSSNAFTISAGVQYYLTDKTMLMANLFNPNKSSFTDYNDEKIPAVLKAGFKHSFSEKVFVTSEIWASSEDKSNVLIGSEYKIHDKVVLRAGLSTFPSATSFGFGLKMNKFDLNVSSGYQNNLGFSPAISILYHGN